MSPGFLVTAAVIGGAVVGVEGMLRSGDAAAFTIAAASLAVAVTHAVVRRALGFLALAMAMASWGAAATSGPVGAVTVEGVLAEDAAPAPAGVALAIDVRAIEWRGARHASSGRVQAYVSGDLAGARFRDWTRGRHVRAPVALRRPNAFLNFGGPSLARQTLRRPFALAGTVKSAALVDVERGAWWHEGAASLRWRVRDAAARLIAPASASAAAIVTAILIGDRAALDEDVQRRLQEAGTFHVIAISGGNVALLTAICFALLRICIRSPRGVAIAALLTVLAYGWVVGSQASVARAVMAAAVYLVLAVAGLRPSPPAALRGVAVILVIADPLTVIDIGAWLSFAATLGILTFGRVWISRLRIHEAAAVLRLPLAAASLVLATVAAELVLLPVSAGAFSRVSIAGLALNLIAIPAMAIVQIAGIAVTVAAGLWPWLAVVAATAARSAAEWLQDSCALIDVAPWLTWRAPPTDPGWTIAYYLSLLAVTVATPRRLRIGCGSVGAICLGVIAWAPGVGRTAPADDRVRISILDVGQGDAVLVQAPGHRAMLVDAGGTPGPFDIGGRVVTPAVWALGARRLDAVVLSHGDRDHVGGAPTVIRDLSPPEIWEGIPVPSDPDRGVMWSLARDRDIAWRTVLAGSRVAYGDVVIDAMHPPAPDWERQKPRNDDSIVLRVRYGLVDVWLTGDAGAEFERAVRATDDGPRLTVLKVGHHGSRTATSERLVAALRPDIAVVSAGRSNLFGHPSREVVGRLEAAGARLFRTDAHGAIVVETDGRTVRVRTATGASWAVTLSGVPSAERRP